MAESFAEIPVLNPISLHADLVNAVGKERMDRSMIVGGSGGVSCKRSWAIPGMGVLELTAEYEVELPVPVFHIPVLHYKEKMRMKTWTGYVKTYEAGSGDNELVYVTETGIVYHRNYQCTYLEPSVRSVAKTQLGELRNSSGEFIICVNGVDGCREMMATAMSQITGIVIILHYHAAD